VLPPKKKDIEPRPSVVDEAEFEESDVVDVRAQSFPAAANFFDQSFTSQFGSREEDWEDEDEDDSFDDDGIFNHEPECRPQ
jgi:DnaJ family protein A protein 2